MWRGHVYKTAATTCVDADDVAFDNTDSCLVATDVQAALEELEAYGPIGAATAGEAVKLGQLVYLTGAGQLLLAQADSMPQAHPAGIVLRDAAISTSACYMLSGLVVATDWTDITGTVNLVPGTRYFLSAADAGGLTTTPPGVASGEWVVLLGTAASTTTLTVGIQIVGKRA